MEGRPLSVTGAGASRGIRRPVERASARAGRRCRRQIPWDAEATWRSRTAWKIQPLATQIVSRPKGGRRFALREAEYPPTCLAGNPKHLRVDRRGAVQANDGVLLDVGVRGESKSHLVNARPQPDESKAAFFVSRRRFRSRIGFGGFDFDAGETL